MGQWGVRGEAAGHRKRAGGEAPERPDRRDAVPGPRGAAGLPRRGAAHCRIGDDRPAREGDGSGGGALPRQRRHDAEPLGGLVPEPAGEGGGACLQVRAGTATGRGRHPGAGVHPALGRPGAGRFAHVVGDGHAVRARGRQAGAADRRDGPRGRGADGHRPGGADAGAHRETARRCRGGGGHRGDRRAGGGEGAHPAGDCAVGPGQPGGHGRRHHAAGAGGHAAHGSHPSGGVRRRQEDVRGNPAIAGDARLATGGAGCLQPDHGPHQRRRRPRRASRRRRMPSWRPSATAA